MAVAALAGGSGIFLAVVVLTLLGAIYGIYTLRGSGIATHPYGKVYGGAPGAHGPGSASGHDGRAHDWSRGTR
jgi:hypothetical protein